MVVVIAAFFLSACAASQPGETPRAQRPVYENVIQMRDVSKPSSSGAIVSGGGGRRPDNTITLIAARAKQPVQIDGKLDDPIWQSAKVYSLELPKQKIANGRGYDAVLPSTAQLAWDDHYLYVGATFRDRDLIAVGTRDQDHHYRMGDTFEVFISPTRATGYWELHSTPKQHRTAWYYPGSGQFGMPHLFEAPMAVDFPAASTFVGTLNESSDLDQSWSVEFAIPIADMAASEQVQWPSNDWIILLARINFSRYVRDHGPQYATAPQIDAADFHRQYQYAKLLLGE